MTRFCSRACARAFLQALKPRRACVYCTTTFAVSPSRKSKRFCSLPCLQAARLLARTRRCAFCLEAFEVSPYRKVAHCSKACESAAKAAARRTGVQMPPPVDGARWIVLSRGLFTLVDEADYGVLSQRVWWANAQGYAETKINGRRVPLHHLILGPVPADRVRDHINRHRLDNRRANLRVVTYAENAANSATQKNNTSGYTGVRRAGARWMAVITVRRVRKYLGVFATPEEGARAYDAAARAYHGAAAVLNFPVEPVTVPGVREV